MLNLFAKDAEHIYVAVGKTDFRKQIDGLVSIVNLQFKLDPFSDRCAFIFCNKRKTAIKVLRYDKNGFILASKKLLEGNCSECGAELKVIGKRLICTEVEFIPAKLKVVQVVQEVAKCTRCGKEGSE